MQGYFLCSWGRRGSAQLEMLQPRGLTCSHCSCAHQGCDFHAWVVGVSDPLPRDSPSPCWVWDAAWMLGFNVWGFSGERLSELWGCLPPILVGMWVQFQLPEAEEGGRAEAEIGTVP